MNPSKYSRVAGILAVVLLWFSVAFLSFYKYAPTDHPVYYPSKQGQAGEFCHYSGVTYDASNSYTPIIDGKSDVTDWHSALYMYECRALLRIAKALSFDVNGIRIQIFWYYVHLAALLMATSILWYRVIRHNILFVILIIPIIWSFYQLFHSIRLGLDFFFFVHLVILCISTILCLQTQRKIYRIAVWCIVAISLFHVVNYRKNAILLLPYITWIFLSFFDCIRHMRFPHKALIWSVVSVCFSLICLYAVPLCLPVVHQNPIAPMLSSDVRIAAILRGEQEQFRDELRTMGASEKALMHSCRNALTAYSSGELSEKGVLLPNAYNFYAKSWINHTDSMIVSRIIQTVEFYCGGSMPVGKTLIAEYYPALRHNPSAWHCYLEAIPKWKMCLRLCIFFIGIALTIWLNFKQRTKSNNWQFYDKATLISCIVALFYAGSFVLVPPTADARYLAPSLFIIWNACWAWGLITLSHFIKKKTYSPE